MVSGRGAKAKGDKYERDLAEFFNRHCGLDCHRTPLSGGGRGEALPDLTGTPGSAIEAKRTERFQPDKFMEQAVKNAGLDMPIVINRKSRQAIEDSHVLLRLQDFVGLYVLYLQHHGYVGRDDDSRDN